MTTAPTPDGAPRRGLLVDYGGVLTTNISESVHAFERAEGLEKWTVGRLLRDEPRARPLLKQLEVGAVTDAEFEAGMAGLLGVRPENLIKRMLGPARLEHTVVDTVRALHREGVPTALLSNSWGVDMYRRDLLEELFDEIVISGEVRLRKPDPEIYRIAARRLGLTPSRCVFVDDLAANLEPARDLGMTVVHHTDPAHTVAELTRLFGLPAVPGQRADGASETAAEKAALAEIEVSEHAVDDNPSPVQA